MATFRAEQPQEQLDYQRAARAIAFLEQHHRERPGLAELARHLGLSQGHAQRLFARYVGVSPKQFVQRLTANRACELLDQKLSVLRTAAQLGLSGGGRLHDLLLATERVSPGEANGSVAPIDLSVGAVSTPLGLLAAARTERGVCAVHFLDHETDLRAFESELRQRFRARRLLRDEAVAQGVASRVFPGGTLPREPLAVLLRGTDLQLQVWCALLALSQGEQCSYGALARALERPSSARAIGNAVGRNPIAVLIPCHRVLRASGALAGYRWGEARKRILLARERSA